MVSYFFIDLGVDNSLYDVAQRGQVLPFLCKGTTLAFLTVGERRCAQSP